MKSGKLFLGVLAGAAIGAIVGILLAPDKGTETRKKLLSKGEGYADALKEKFSNVVDTASKGYEKILGDGQEMVS